ncbi:MAG: hypothetical protein K940chlam9_00249 [Chlamydiae bacterium]|nr:hypothetical protein [Chlamydiota bacterium]
MSGKVNPLQNSMSVYFSCHSSLFKKNYNYIMQGLKSLGGIKTALTESEEKHILGPMISILEQFGEEGFNVFFE